MLEKLKLQLFAASDEEMDDPDIGEQDDDIIDYEENDDEDVDEPDELEDDENEEDDDVGDDDEEDATEDKPEEDKPFMVFRSKDEHQKYMDNIIGKRLGEARKKQEEQDNVISTLQQYFKVDNFDGLKQKSEELLEDIAYERGITKEDLLKQQREQRELRELRALQEQQRQQAFFNAFTNDVDKLSKSNPDLYGDVKAEDLLQDGNFLQMLGQGIPFKQAYDALHVDELIKKQTKKAKKNVIDDVKAKGTRIKENATKRSKAGAIKIDVNKLTDEELEELERRAENGEKIRF